MPRRFGPQAWAPHRTPNRTPCRNSRNVSTTSRPDRKPSRGIFDLDKKTAELKSLEQQAGAAGFWDGPQEARTVILKQLQHLTNILDNWRDLSGEVEELASGVELCEEEESDADLQQELLALSKGLEQRLTELELRNILGGENDSRNAIGMIHSGAGGTESADWAGMLFRMYQRWAENRDYTINVLDMQPGDEGGVKSVTFEVLGDYAFGHLKAEVGVHRLVRISPYDANKRRHTSFASVFVYPEVDDEIVVEINESELRIETYRAQGAGGQHINTTDSAVRITHLPSGIVVQCQNERSQHKNRATAMKVLRARLYEREQEAKEAERDRLNEQKQEISWGSQIRSYVLHPYQLVKDHRTEHETGNAMGVLDGNIDTFIEQALLQKVV